MEKQIENQKKIFSVVKCLNKLDNCDKKCHVCAVQEGCDNLCSYAVKNNINEKTQCIYWEK